MISFNPRLLVFDLDGTLVDSRRDLVECVNATLAHCGLLALPEERIAAFIGDGVAALIERSLRAAGSAADPTAVALPFFLEHYNLHLLDHTHLYPGVLETLSALRQMNRPPHMAVLTNKPVRPSRLICQALGMSPCFFQVYGGNSFADKKPAPTGLLSLWHEAEALEGRALVSEEVVMIGDSEVDVRTARNAGVRSVGCTWGFATAKLIAEKPDRLAHAPRNWLELFGPDD